VSEAKHGAFSITSKPDRKKKKFQKTNLTAATAFGAASSSGGNLGCELTAKQRQKHHQKAGTRKRKKKKEKKITFFWRLVHNWIDFRSLGLLRLGRKTAHTLKQIGYRIWSISQNTKVVFCLMRS
jgi:hypothetical protein